MLGWCGRWDHYLIYLNHLKIEFLSAVRINYLIIWHYVLSMLSWGVKSNGRITSYNVCYTKLLRTQAYGILDVPDPLYKVTEITTGTSSNVSVYAHWFVDPVLNKFTITFMARNNFV